MENSLQMRRLLSSTPVLGIALQPLYFTLVDAFYDGKNTTRNKKYAIYVDVQCIDVKILLSLVLPQIMLQESYMICRINRFLAR